MNNYNLERPKIKVFKKIYEKANKTPMYSKFQPPKVIKHSKQWL